MRTIHLILIAFILGTALGGCGRSSSTVSRDTASSSVAEAAPASIPICGKNEQLCSSCDGSRQFCAEFCPHCIPPLHDLSATTAPELASVLEVRGAECAGSI